MINYIFTQNFLHKYNFLHQCMPLEYNQKDAMFSLSVYFYKLLYMFQAIPQPIIRSITHYIQRQVLSNQYCCLLLSWMKWKFLTTSTSYTSK